MAEGNATRSSRGHRTICVPIEEEDYLRIINDPKAFRLTVDDCFSQNPELFPANFALGYELKDGRMSIKQQIPPAHPLERRLGLQHPAVLSDALYDRTHGGSRRATVLRKFGVPFWALARVFGGDPMSWYRMECGLGRFSVVGTTVRQATLPEHSTGRRASSTARWPKGLHRYDRRQGVLSGSGTRRDGGNQRLDGRLQGLQRRSP